MSETGDNSLKVNFNNESLESGRYKKSKRKLKFAKPKNGMDEGKNKTVQKYFTSGRNIKAKRDLFQEPSPFSYPKDLEELAYDIMTKAWRNEVRLKELKLKYNEKNNYQTRQENDLLERLQVDDAPLTSLKTIQDVDPNFFKSVEARPIAQPVNTRRYIETVRDVLRTKIVNGYREGTVMLIEQNLIAEQKMIDEIEANFKKYVDTFEEFLYNDHKDSMKLLKESEEEARLTAEKYEEYKTLSKEYGALRSILYNTEEKWRNSKMYQSFLFMVSPMDWRKEHDPYYTEKNNNEELNEVFSKYRLTTLQETVSLEDLVSQFLDDCDTKTDTKLYFNEPDELIEVFRFMELQNLNSLLHSEELALPLLNVKEGMVRAEQLFNDEINSLKENIDKLETGLIWEENRAKYLKELAMELINGKFRKLIVDENVLNLKVFIEDVYETRIGPNDANLTNGEMMKTIEARYLEELLKLDKMPSDLVNKIESKFYAEEERLLRNAEKAAQKLLELERLFQTVTKAFSAPFRRTGREIKWRSPPVNPPEGISVRKRSLTKDEKEFLDIFTDYCSHTDDAKNYGINN